MQKNKTNKVNKTKDYVKMVAVLGLMSALAAVCAGTFPMGLTFRVFDSGTGGESLRLVGRRHSGVCRRLFTVHAVRTRIFSSHLGRKCTVRSLLRAFAVQFKKHCAHSFINTADADCRQPLPYNFGTAYTVRHADFPHGLLAYATGCYTHCYRYIASVAGADST